MRNFSQALQFPLLGHAVTGGFSRDSEERPVIVRERVKSEGARGGVNVKEDAGPSRHSPVGGSGGLGRYAGYGLAWVLTALIGGWIGLELDARLGTSPLLAVLGTLGGAGAGMYTLYVRLIVEPGSKRKERKGSP